MPSFRILMLVMLVVMLPVRGVMAAAMPCAPLAAAAADEARAHAGSEGHAHLHGAGHHPADTDEAPGSPHDSKADADTCHLCSACCSVPPMPSAAPLLPAPIVAVSTGFPALAAPAPVFQSEGPERPPRSI